MSKISGWNFSQNITSADNCKQKNEDLDTWYVGMNDFARIAGGQNSRSNILSPRAFLEFLAKGRCEQVPDMRSCLSSGAMEQGSS